MPSGSTSIGHSLSTFFDAVGKFFSDLAAVHWGLLALGLFFFGANLALRSRAFYSIMRAAYPGVPIQWLRPDAKHKALQSRSKSTVSQRSIGDLCKYTRVSESFSTMLVVAAPS